MLLNDDSSIHSIHSSSCYQAGVLQKSSLLNVQRADLHYVWLSYIQKYTNTALFKCHEYQTYAKFLNSSWFKDVKMIFPSFQSDPIRHPIRYPIQHPIQDLKVCLLTSDFRLQTLKWERNGKGRFVFWIFCHSFQEYLVTLSKSLIDSSACHLMQLRSQ